MSGAPVAGRGPRAGAGAMLADVGAFAAVGQAPLRPYQLDCARAIVRSVARGEGRTFTVMFARQMGKNETSARIEAYLLALFAGRGGNIVKAAPSFKPQIVNSMLRLRQSMQHSPLLRDRWRPAFGYIYQVGRASCTFLSADASANVVGATASLLLEIDEAQDVDPEKYTRDFRPMASSTNATTVLYGTAWARDTLLERQKRINLAEQERIRQQLHFEYDWTVLAALNAHYRRFVEAEIERLGLDHPSIRTQYLLECMADAGRLFSDEQRARLRGEHARLSVPVEGRTYVVGIDVAGADEEAEDAIARALKPRRDSTVIAIGELDRTATGEPRVAVVETIWWTGHGHERQLADILALCERWQFASVVMDAGGIGYGLAHLLAARLPGRIRPIVFTRGRKSELGYALLGTINTDRFRLYRHDGSPESVEMWWEIERTRYQMHAQQVMSWSVPEREGHDDFVVALALLAHAAEQSPVVSAGALVRPAPPEEDEW